MNNKHAEIDSFLTLFVSTIVIIVIILVFTISSGIFIKFSNTQHEFFSFNPLESNIKDHLNGYSVGPFSVLSEEICGKGQALAVNGPYKGRCLCDSTPEGGYYFSSSSKPFFWFFPPCEKSEYSGTSARPVDISVELTEDNKLDEGICVYYISNRYYNELSIGKESPFQNIDGVLFEDIFDYEMTNKGYIEKIYKIPEKNENFIYTRDACAGMNKKERLIEPVILAFRTYPIFYNYNNAPNNILEGYLYDLGYCFLFDSQGEIKSTAGVGVTTRDDCYESYLREKQKKEGVRVGFFITEKNEGEMIEKIDSERKGSFSLFYSFDYHANVRGDNLEEDYIKDNCKRFKDYDLTFITGALEYKNGELRLRGDGSVYDFSDRDEYALNACKLEIEHISGEEFSFFGKYDLMKKNDFDRLGEGNICCYLNEAGNL
jgi:hypothetical protein